MDVATVVGYDDTCTSAGALRPLNDPARRDISAGHSLQTPVGHIKGNTYRRKVPE